MADILKQYERQTLTDPLEARALELIGLAEKATGGEWFADHAVRSNGSVSAKGGGLVAETIFPVVTPEEGSKDEREANAKLIVAARNHAPAIARAYLEARAEIERLRGLLLRAETLTECSAYNLSGSAGRGARKSSSIYFDLLADIKAALHPQPDTTGEK